LSKITILAIFLLLILSSSHMLLVFAEPSVQQTTTTPACPTYQVNLVVDLVDSYPLNAAVGDTVVTRVHVAYQDGTPVMLSPEAVSFLWTGSSGQKEFDNVPVTYAATPGFYNYTQTITPDLINATGQGKITVWVVACSCRDVSGNLGPVSLTDSDLTLTPSDDSNLNVGIPPPAVTPVGTYFVPLTIIFLVMLAVLIFLVRGRRRRQK
jgi:hypothetical protein